MELIEILAAFTFSAILLSALLVFFLSQNKKLDVLDKTLLSLVFIGISIRISKSILYYLFHIQSDLAVSLGLLGMAIIGPFALLYTVNQKEKFAFNNIAITINSILIIFSVLLCYLLYWEIKVFLYRFWTILFMICSFFIVFYSISNRKYIKNDIWVIVFSTSLLLIGISFSWQMLSDSLTEYAWGSTLVAGIQLLLIMYLIKYPLKQNKSTTRKVNSEIIEIIKKYLIDDEYYTRHGINLSTFSNEIGIPAYQVSDQLNLYYQKSFPEIVNNLRIERVKSLLKQEDQKVESIAYDVGFNSPSNFYSAFKKITKKSPSEFRKQLS